MLGECHCHYPFKGYGNTFDDEHEKNKTNGICPYLSMFFRADIKIMGDSLVTHTTIDGDKLDESVLKDIIVDDQIDKDFVKNVSELSTDEVTL